MNTLSFNVPLLSRLVCILGIFLWAFILTIKYYCFGFYDWDFALYSQTMWALGHGTTFASLFGSSFLADHAHFIAFVITPVYFIFHHPLTLIYMEIFSFFSGAYILYKLAEKLSSPYIAFALMLIYIFHPANIFMLLYEFHFESLGIAFIFLLFYFQYLERYKAFIVTAVLLMLVKENMPLIVVMIGVYGLLFKPAGRIQWGVVPLVLGSGMFILTMFVLMPMVRQNLPSHQNIYWGLYSSLGHTPGGIIKNFFLNPAILLKQLATLRNLHFMEDVLGGFVVGAFFCPAVVLVGAPLFLQNLLSSNSAQHTIFYHYTATLVPFAAIAAAYGFAFLIKRYPAWLTYLCLVFCLVLALQSFIKYLPPVRQRIYLCVDRKAPARQLLIDKIPSNAGVVASFVFLSHLSQRQNVYALYNVWKNIDYFTGQQPFILPSSVHYALIDYDDPWLLYDLKHRHVALPIKDFISQGGWNAKYAKEGLVLYER